MYLKEKKKSFVNEYVKSKLLAHFTAQLSNLV